MFCVTVSVAVGTPRDGQDTTGGEFAERALICRDVRTLLGFLEFDDTADPSFKTTAIDHSAIPPASKCPRNSRDFNASRQQTGAVSPTVSPIRTAKQSDMAIVSP